MDNLSAHKTKEIGEFVVKNAHHPDWDTLAKAMAEHIRYRNRPTATTDYSKPNGATHRRMNTRITDTTFPDRPLAFM